MPYRVVDASGAELTAVTEFLRNLSASDCSPATLRSYAYELFGWLRFLWTVDMAWDRATRAEARDYALWLGRARKRPRRGAPAQSQHPGRSTRYREALSRPDLRRGDPAACPGSHPRVLRLPPRREHGRPLINPFPAARGGAATRSTPTTIRCSPGGPTGRAAPYQPKAGHAGSRERSPTSGSTSSSRRWAHTGIARLLAFWISTGARAQELLGAVRGRVDPADQLIGVIRKGSRALQMLPASADAFVWLRLYHHELGDACPTARAIRCGGRCAARIGRLSYDAARMMFARAQQSLVSTGRLHDLRHSAAYRMVSDPRMSLVDVQWVLGHAHLSTDRAVPDPQSRRAGRAAACPPRPPGRGRLAARPAPGYRPEVLAGAAW